MGDLDADFEDLKENRFAHLLKPIRDMQDNFNVDLAHELEEYLDQLENAQFSFEGARHGMVDFAEAALLIQGSTCVYSKKVEHLYNLVYQALEAVKGRKRHQGLGPDGQPFEGDASQLPAGARGRGAAVARDGDDEEDEGLEQFWNVETLLKESKDLDLAPGDGVIATAGTTVRPPAALLALEDHGQGAASSTGGKGDGDTGVYRLQQCIVHCSGALLLDPRDGDMYDQELRFIGPHQRKDKSLEQLIDAHRLEQPTQLVPEPPTQAHMPGQLQQAPGASAPMDVDPGQANDYDDGGGFDGGADWPSDNEDAMAAPAPGTADADPMATDGAPPAAAMDDDATAGQEAAANTQRPQAVVTRARGAGHAAAGDDEDAAEADGEEAEMFDPYRPLDPAVKGRLAERPLVIRKPRRTRKMPTQTAKRDTTTAAAGGLLLPEYSYCLAFLRPAHAAEEKLEKRRVRAEVGCKPRNECVAKPCSDAAGPVFDACDAAAAVAADEAATAEPADDVQEPQGPQQYGFDDDDDGGGFGGGGGGSDLDDDVDPAMAGPGGFGRDDGGFGGSWHQPEGDADDAEARGRSGGLGRWPGVVPPMGFLGGPDDGRAFNGEEPSYEELCRAHMESMLMAAAAREVQSDLARRVSGWRQRIDPVLKAEESRPGFDIQDYGERLLGRLAGLKLSDGDQPQPAAEPVAAVGGGGSKARLCANFSVIAADLQKFEVSRMFSAMLQLINNRNVAIFKTDGPRVPPGEVPDEPFTLQLLSTDMYHKTMRNRLAAVPQGGGATSPCADGLDHDDGENRATQRHHAAEPRGKAGGGAKRAKKAAAPLGDTNMDG